MSEDVELPPLHHDTRLTRPQCAAALTAHGYPIKASTLCYIATMRSGPPYQKWGIRTFYTWGEVLQWAQARGRHYGYTADARAERAKARENA